MSSGYKIKLTMNKSILPVGVMIILSLACASRMNYNDSNYEVVCQGQDAKGGYKINVYMSNWDETLAIQQAKERAIHSIMFKGVKGSDCADKPPLCTVTYETGKAYFDNFFATKEYAFYVFDVKKIAADATNLKLGYTVSINYSALQKKLAQQGYAFAMVDGDSTTIDGE
jgi:hypothetical protein